VTEYGQLLQKLERLASAIESLAASNIMLVEQIAGEVDEHDTYTPRYLDGTPAGPAATGRATQAVEQ
jgi:hypothetical protein